MEESKEAEYQKEIEEFVKNKMEQAYKKYGTIFDSDQAEEILERDVMKLGNSGRVAIPSKHIGKKVRIFILKEKEEDTKKDSV